MRIDELSMQQERNPTSVSQLLTQFQDLQNTVNSLSDARECFYDPATARSSGASHVPSQPLIIPSPREVRSRDSGWPRDTRFVMGTSVERKQMLSRDSGLPHDTRNVMSTSGNVFEAYLLEKDHPQLSSKIRGIWQSPSRGLTSGNTMEHGRG